MSDLVRYKVSFVCMKSGKELFSVKTIPLSGTSVLYEWLDTYKRYILKRPYTRLIIEPFCNIQTGELFTKND